MAVSLVLLTISVFMYHGFRHELASNQGFRKDHLLMMSFDPSLVHYSDAQTQQFYKQLVERTRSAPGVRAVALALRSLCRQRADAVAVVPEGYQFPTGKDNATVFANRVDEKLLRNHGSGSLVRGRGFRETDSSDTPRVAVVNEQFAQHYWPGQDALGKRLRVQDAKNPNSPWVQIVGITKTGKYLWIAEPPTEFLSSVRAEPEVAIWYWYRSRRASSAGIAAPLREVVRALDVNQPIFNVRTIEQFYEMRVVSSGNTIMEIVAGMGLMGMVLAMIGLYGLGAYAVSRRTREIGIRMAIASQHAFLQSSSGLADDVTSRVDACALWTRSGPDSKCFRRETTFKVRVSNANPNRYSRLFIGGSSASGDHHAGRLYSRAPRLAGRSDASAPARIEISKLSTPGSVGRWVLP